MQRRQFVYSSLLAGSAVAGGKLFATDASKKPGSEGWPCWRGPTRDGVLANAQFPSDFSNLTQLWTCELADSYSGPVLAGDMVFTTETVDKKSETLVALNKLNGDVLWKQEWQGAMSVPFFAKSNGDWIRATPATDGKYLVLGGMCDVVACFDVATGQEVWRIDFVKDHGATLPSFGLVCSPLIDGEFVYMQAGGAVRQIRLADGALGWATMEDEGGMYGGAFSSPTIATINGVRQLVAQTRTTLCGLELTTGNVLWKQDIEAFRGMNILTPTVWNNAVFTSSYGGKSQLYRIDATAGSPQLLWEGKAEAYMSSPVVVNDHLYMHLKNNRLCCIDLQSGEEKWRTTPFGKYWSMVTDGSKILALDEKGELLLVAANPEEYQLLDRKQVSEEPSWAHLAILGENIYVRRQHGLDAYLWK